MITDKKIETALLCISNRFIAHYDRTDWGDCVWLMEKNGKAHSRVYWYSDDDTTVYLDNLSVSPNWRRKGLGTKLQKIREKIGFDIGARTSCLWVKKDTWMHDWYRRRGYVDHQDNEAEDDTIWMKKSLINY